MITLFSLIARKWLIGAAIAVFVAYSGWLSWKVRSITYRNLTSYYEKQIAETKLAAEKARLKAEEEHANELRAWADQISSLDIPDTNAALERLCSIDPNCKTSSGRRKN